MYTDEIINVDVPHPLKPVDSYHYPSLYYHDSGYLIAYPIEVFHRPNIVNMKIAINKLKKESEKIGLIPFVKLWSGNYSFGIKLKTNNQTREENEKICKAFNNLKKNRMARRVWSSQIKQFGKQMKI